MVQKSTGRIIGGNGRLVAIQLLGWKKCDVVELDIDDLTATALGIALNRTGELAEWSEETLTKLLSELRDENALDGVGYSEDDIDALLDELSDDEPADADDPGPAEPPEKPVTRPGDLWLLGDHRLLCGDSTNVDDVACVRAGEKASLMTTDPPYCVEYTGADRPQDSERDWSDKYLGDPSRSLFFSLGSWLE